MYTHSFGKKYHKKKMKNRGTIFDNFIANLTFTQNYISNHYTDKLTIFFYTKYFGRAFVDKQQRSHEN